MRRHLLASLTAALLVSGLVAAPTSGADQGTECRGRATMTFDPGISEQPSSGIHHGREGTADCNGRVRGEQPTGPVTIEWDGRYGTQDSDTCSLGEGWGLATHTVPTADGSKSFKVVFTYRYVRHADGVVSGAFEGDYFSGTFEVEPLQGDCVGTAVTKAGVIFRGTWHEHRGGKHLVNVLFLL
jgi:hypothetical protein